MPQSLYHFLMMHEPFTTALSESLLFPGIMLVTLGTFILISPRLGRNGRITAVVAGIILYFLALILFHIPKVLCAILALYFAAFGAPMVLGTLLGRLFSCRRLICE